MSNKVVLWNYFRSSASWRVRIALNLKGIDFEYKPIDLLKGEQFSEEFTKKNAKQEIPVIEIDGLQLTQSLPIIEYINETRPQEPNLLPKDPAKRAKARAIAEIVNAGIQPYQNTNVVKRLNEQLGEEKKNEWLQHYLRKGFRSLEEMLKQTSGKFCVGDEISIADLALVPQVYNGYRFNIDMTDFPTVRRIYEELNKIEEVRKAHAHRQPDTPAEMREN